MPLTKQQQTLEQFMREYAPLIHEELNRLISIDTEPYAIIFAAARYSLLSGGKRLRPLLTLAATQALGSDMAKALQPACALEMIHTYSMIHDDLPCMDNDDYRRGKPTLHKVHPEAIALLAGDLLLTYPFELLANSPNLGVPQRLELVRVLAQASGGHGMIGGQVIDILQDSEATSLELLQMMHTKKTGALLTAALDFGAIIAEATDAVREKLRNFGAAIGLAYQIIDDVLDVTASEQKHGRQTGSDHLNGKRTYVNLLGLEQAQNEAERLLTYAKQTLAELSLQNEWLQELADLLVHRTS